MPELVYECPETISFQLGKESLRAKFNCFVECVADNSLILADFFSRNEEGFFDNKVSSSFYIQEKNIWITEGMKIGKALKYFEGLCSDDFLEFVRLEASRLVQQNVVSGKLCVSVHPLDYLSSSENNHGWRSCHALDGEYRSGNLSYMLDGCTVVVYLKSDKEEVELPRFPGDVPWNDKKWRCLFYFDDVHQVVWAGRQYPFSSDVALKLVKEKLFEPMNFFSKRNLPKIFWTDWHCPIIAEELEVNGVPHMIESKYVAQNGHIQNINKWITNDEQSMAFNDLLSSSVYVPYIFNFGLVPSYMTAPPMKVGAAVPCVCCGQDIKYSESMLCNDCLLRSDQEMEEIVECVECGCRTFSDLDYYYGDAYYCPTCYAEHILTCSDCGETFYTWDKDICIDEEGNIKCRYCRTLPHEDRLPFH